MLLAWVTFLAGGVYAWVWVPAAGLLLAVALAVRPRVARDQRNRALDITLIVLVLACVAQLVPMPIELIRSIDPSRDRCETALWLAAGPGGARSPLDSDHHRAARHARSGRHPAVGDRHVLDLPACVRTRRHRTPRASRRVHRTDRVGRGHRTARTANRSAVRRMAAARYRRAPIRPVRQSQSHGDVDHHGVPARFRLSAGPRAAPRGTATFVTADRGRRSGNWGRCASGSSLPSAS